MSELNKENVKRNDDFKEKRDVDPFELPTDDDIADELKAKKTPIVTTYGKRNSPFARCGFLSKLIFF